jgi:hypothetical protein
MPVTAMHGWEARMRSRPPMSGTVGQYVSNIDRLIAVCALLYFGILIAVSGPHLVHHLADLHSEHRHPHPHKSQPTHCLVLSLMQHIPLAGDCFASPLAFLPTVERAIFAQPLQAYTTPRPTFQARSPPTMPRS